MSANNFIWVFLLVVWIGASAWWHTCKIKLLCGSRTEAVLPQSPALEKPSLHLMDGEYLMISSAENFAFAKSGHHANLQTIQTELDSLAAYLNTHPERRVVLTGYYSSDEINTSSWPNLGQARAEEVKSFYVSKGLPASIFDTKGRLSEDLVFIGDSLFGGIDFQFLDDVTFMENSLAEKQKFQDIFKPLDIYFNSGSAEYIKTPDNETFLKEASLYLSRNQESKLLLTGHTDNTGSAESNLELSGERAESVKDAFIQAGISPEQIETLAKGDTEPKISNDTPEGKATNRRVSVVVISTNPQ